MKVRCFVFFSIFLSIMGTENYPMTEDIAVIVRNYYCHCDVSIENQNLFRDDNDVELAE